MLILSVSDERPGHRQQAKALAEALCQQAPPSLVESSSRHVTHVLPAWRRWFAPYGELWAKKAASKILGADMPAVVVGCGQQASVALRAIKTCRPSVHTVQIFDPKRCRKDFDVLCVPSHDVMPNAKQVVSFHAALSPIHEAWLSNQSHVFESILSPSPALTVLLGGSRNGATYAPTFSQALRQQIITLLGDEVDWSGVHLITSRRTPKQALANWMNVMPEAHWHLFNQQDAVNPYSGLLARSARFVVTADSASMLADAYATGKPVDVAAGMTLSGKPKRWVDALTQAMNHPYSMHQQTQIVAKQVWSLLGDD